MPGYVRAADRREQLLAAARTVLIRDGLDELTLRGVATEAGVHLSTLQYIFRSRAELVDALVTRVLDDAHAGGFESGDGGLAVELTRQVEWFARQFLDDPAMLELFRHEYLAAVGRDSTTDSTAGTGAPSRGPLLPVDHAGRIAAIGRDAGERYRLSADDLGELWWMGLAGLFLGFLAHRDADRFARGAALLVDAVVAAAQPVRATR